MLAALLLLCVSVSLCACGRVNAGSSAQRGTPTGSNTLRVGVRDNISGFGYLNEDTGRYSGLEIDIAEEMADRLGYSMVEYTSVTPETREELLADGEIDCILACFSTGEEREEVFDFSPAYYEDASVVMVEDSSLFSSLSDLVGYTIGTVSGTNATSDLISKLTELGLTNGKIIEVPGEEKEEEVRLENFDIVQLPTHAELSEALEEGSIDAMCADGCLIKTYFYSDRNILPTEISSQDYAVATVKDSNLSEPVAEAIQDMLEDGTIEALIDKWD